jgi:hypothetical protein
MAGFEARQVLHFNERTRGGKVTYMADESLKEEIEDDVKKGAREVKDAAEKVVEGVGEAADKAFDKR